MPYALLIVLFGCQRQDGGSCSYDDYTGTCTLEADGSVTFTGNIDGNSVTIPDNDIYPSTDDLVTGDSLECTLSFIYEGTCSPCSLDIGECSGNAYSVYLDNREE